MYYKICTYTYTYIRSALPQLSLNARAYCTTLTYRSALASAALVRPTARSARPTSTAASSTAAGTARPQPWWPRRTQGAGDSPVAPSCQPTAVARSSVTTRWRRSPSRRWPMTRGRRLHRRPQRHRTTERQHHRYSKNEFVITMMMANDSS